MHLSRHTSRRIAVVAAAFITGSALAESVRFEMIPDAAEANDMSPDGRFVVGSLLAGGNYLWDRQTDVVTPLGAIRAVAVSDDGTVVLGNIDDPEGVGSQVGAIWTQSSGVWTSLGLLPNAGACPSRSTAYELSADGSVAVGLGWYDGCNAVGFVWTQATGMVDLEELANGSNRASVVSADGSVIAGFAQGSFSRTPARWDAATADGELLDPPDGDVLGEIQGISDDGTVLLGTWLDEDLSSASNAVAWTEGIGPQIIGAGQLIPGWEGIPMDIADDETIVGFDFLFGNRRAWIAMPHPEAGPAGRGLTGWNMTTIETLVANGNGTIPEGFSPQVCQAVSTDGRVIVGHSGFPVFGAFIITRCPEDVDKDGSVAVTDLLQLLGFWGECGECGSSAYSCRADFNNDCKTDVVDLLSLLAHWGGCP